MMWYFLKLADNFTLESSISMKKFKKHWIPLLVIILFISACVGIYCLHRDWTKERKAQVNIDIPIDDITHLEINYKGYTHVIKNPEIISEVIQLINDEPVTYTKEQQKHFWQISAYAYSLKHKICIYSGYKCLDTLYVGSGSIRHGKLYNLTNEGELRKKIEDILSYCQVYMEQTGYNADKFETYGIEISKNEAIDEYNSMERALPIRDSEFKTSDTYYFIRTYSNEEVYVYYVGKEKYIEYRKGDNKGFFRSDK